MSVWCLTQSPRVGAAAAAAPPPRRPAFPTPHRSTPLPLRAQALALLESLCPSSASGDPGWAAERHRLQLLGLSASAADGRKDTVTTLLDAGAMHPVQLQLSGLPDAFQQYSGPYYRVEAPPERRLSFGRPVYRSGGCWLFFAEDAGNEKGETAREGAAPTAQWIVGREEDVGRTHGWMYVDDEAASPELIRAEWQLGRGRSTRAARRRRRRDGGPTARRRRAARGAAARMCRCSRPPSSPARPSRRPLRGVGRPARVHHAAPQGVQALRRTRRRRAPAPPTEPDIESPLLLAARGSAGAAPVVQLFTAEGFTDYRALGAAATHTVRIGLLEAALLRHADFVLVHDLFTQLQAVQRFPKPLGAALSNLLGVLCCSTAPGRPSARSPARRSVRRRCCGASPRRR